MSDTYFTEKRDGRNHAGVKDSCDLYRTFNGDHYPSWEIAPTAEYIKALRAAGVRVRTLKIDGETQSFIHHADVARASTVAGAA